MKEMAKLFERPDGGQMRVVEGDDGDPWFVAKDVCDGLGIANSRDAMDRLDEDEKGVALIDSPGGVQEFRTITEAGVYRLVFSSRKKVAQDFKRWLAHDVIPSIRKTGVYAVPVAHPMMPIDYVDFAERYLAIMDSTGCRDVRDEQAAADIVRNAMTSLRSGPGVMKALPPGNDDEIITVGLVEVELELPLTQAQRIRAGRYAAEEFRRRTGKEPETIQQSINGRPTPVKAYRRKHFGVVKDAVVRAAKKK